ncbi:MAG: malto-oligosyltrehalose trehalohydrolase, partial [Gemmatimonadales bacterium]|nr:malto-oligosyltrehalose trehalohydrolase [Gemmatimonadales bacterium]
YEGVLADVPAGSNYYYRLDGNDRPDPVSRYRPSGVHGPSRVVDPSGFRWTDSTWTGRATADLVIYELHVGTFTDGGTFDAAIERLGNLTELGITAVELMPVAQFPGSRNWGYDGVSLYAPQSTYSGPDGLCRLVDAAHAVRLAVLLDVVYNHLGPEGNYLGEFGPYFSVRHPTPWGPGWNLDGPDSDEVRRYLIDNARYWITEFHLDGLRLDAADKIVDLGALHILEEIGTAVHEQAHALGRRVSVIAESDANDPRLIRPLTAGGYGLDAQWTDDFHHAVHAAVTGERMGYYADFGGVEPVARAFGQRYVHDGHYSPYRRRRFGRPAADLPGDRFVVCLQNHDQVGNRAGGERLAALVSPAALRLVACVLLLSPYVPLLFMGEEHGETNPFLYFVSHGDPELIAAVREARRREFAAFGWEGLLPDPQAEATFEASRVDWERASAASHAALRRLYRDLLALRRDEASLRAGASNETVVHDEAGRWVTLTRTTGERRWMAAFNFGEEEQLVPGPSDCWRLVLSSEARDYGGDGIGEIVPGALRLPALSAALVRVETP